MISDTDDGLIIKLRVVPNSSKNLILCENDSIKVKLTAQPIEGKANKSLVEYLSKELRVPKSKITILKGEGSKDKTLLICVSDDEKISYIKSYLTNS